MSMGSMWASTTNADGNGPVRISPDIEQVVTELAARFPEVPPEALRTVVTEEFGIFDGAAITTYVPVLVARAATARLTRNGCSHHAKYPQWAAGMRDADAPDRILDPT